MDKKFHLGLIVLICFFVSEHTQAQNPGEAIGPQWDPWIGSAENGWDSEDVVLAMAWYSEENDPSEPAILYVGGSFTIDSPNGPVKNLAKFEDQQWRPVDSEFNNTIVFDMEIFDDYLYVGTSSGLFFLDGTYVWDVDYDISGGAGSIYALHASDSEGRLYVGGSFDHAYVNHQFQVVNNITKMDSSNDFYQIPSVINGGSPYGVDGPVNDLEEYNSEIYAGGDFAYSGAPDNRGLVARVSNGTLIRVAGGLNASNSHEQGGVFALKVFNDRLYAGGVINIAHQTGSGSMPVNHLVEYDGISNAWTGDVSQGVTDSYYLFAPVQTLEVFNDDNTAEKLFVGGSFDMVGNTISTKNIAKWDGVSWHKVHGGMNRTDPYDRVQKIFSVYHEDVWEDLFIGGKLRGVVLDQDLDPTLPLYGIVRYAPDEYFVSTCILPYGLGNNGYTLHAYGDTTLAFTLDAGEDYFYRTFGILGSTSGTYPGSPLPGGHKTLPLNWDDFTDLVIAYWNTPLFLNFLGDLDSSGRAVAYLQATNISEFSGAVMHFAFTLYNPYDLVSFPFRVVID